MRIFKHLILSCTVLLALACEKGEGDENALNDDDGEVIQLKGVALLASSLTNVVGLDKDMDINDTETSLLEKYKANFGGIEGLSVGKTFADQAGGSNKMTGYFMSLGHIASNAAQTCNLTNDPACACDSVGAAKDMLSRAIPYVDFSDESQQDIVSDFADMCKENQVEAITALLASVAFAKRN